MKLKFLLIAGIFGSNHLVAETRTAHEALPSLEESAVEKTNINKDPIHKLSRASNIFDFNTQSLKNFDSSTNLKDNHDIFEEQKTDDLLKIQPKDEIRSENSSSPILKFILKELRPLVETRIDFMLVKSGFASNVRELIKIESQLKIEIIEENKTIGALPATCGQRAEISFTAEDEYRTILDDEHGTNKEWIVIGQNKLPKGLELGLIGMKIGETRKIFSPHNLNSGKSAKSSKLFSTNKPVIFQVTLHDIKNDENHEEIKENLKFYDVATSISRELSCTDHIQLNLKILDYSGQVVYKNPSQFKFTLGGGHVPYLEEILMSARNSGKRLAFAETKYLQELKRISSFKGIEKILDQNKSVILELSPKLIKNN